MIKKYIFSISAFLFFLTPICKAKEHNNDLAVGIAVMNVNKLTVSTTHKNIKDMSIIFCPLNDNNLSKCLTVSGANFNEVNSRGDVSDVILGNVVHEFSVDATRLDNSDASVGIAFLYDKNIHPGIYFIDNKVGRSMLVTIEGERFEIKSCNGSEGVHVYSSNPNEHLYYSYGYTVTNTCSNEVYE